MHWYLSDLDSDDSIEINDGDILGRCEGEHQFPDLAKMSRKHCQIIFENNFIYLMDLESRNGTYVNSAKCEPLKKVLLTDKSIIMFGGKTFMLKKKDTTRSISIRRPA